MSKILRVNNLATSVTTEMLQGIGAEYGKVAQVKLAESPFSGKSRGFGFIEMATENETASCLAGLQDREFEGQKLSVALAPADQLKKPRRRA
jgi:RNA recognition motif-containing protein